MYCNPIGQSDNPENEIMKLFDPSPESDSTVALNLNADGVFDDPNAPFFLQIGALPQDFVLEIRREFIPWHVLNSITIFRCETSSGQA
jgi:hypothetical protein